MKEIKFRAWSGSKMYYSRDSLRGTHLAEFSKQYYLPMSYLLGDSNDWNWMQYTGLKDKNGKEIYEGDELIVWLGSYGGGVKVVELMSFYYDCLEYSYEDEDLEVVGNIYENKEILR